MKIKAVLFDMDDTLFPEIDFVESGYRTVASIFGDRFRIPPDELFNRMRGVFRDGDRGSVFDEALGMFGPDVVEDAVRQYRAHSPDIRLTAEARDAFFLLKLPVAVVTDGWAEVQRNKAKALGLLDRMPVVLTDLLGGRSGWKPSPAGLVRACELLGVKPESCVYVGDNPHKDFVAARAAGMRSVRYKARFQLHLSCEPRTGEGADAEIRDLRTLHDQVLG